MPHRTVVRSLPSVLKKEFGSLKLSPKDKASLRLTLETMTFGFASVNQKDLDAAIVKLKEMREELVLGGASITILDIYSDFIDGLEHNTRMPYSK